jgi:hypothetical protein
MDNDIFSPIGDDEPGAWVGWFVVSLILTLLCAAAGLWGASA